MLAGIVLYFVLQKPTKNKTMRKITQFALAITMMVAVSHQVSAQCPTPTGLTMTVASTTSSVLNWPAVAGAVSYRLEIQNATGNNVPFLATANTVTNTYTISGLTAGANYKYKVRTICSGGKSGWSAYYLFSSGSGQTQCGIPTGLAATPNGSGATLNWLTSTGPLTRYNIEVQNASGNNVPFNTLLISTTNNVSVTGLLPLKNYKFKVRKICGGIKSSWTAWTNFTTTALANISDTRIMNDNNSAGVIVYPNPASDNVHIKLDRFESEELESIQLLDSSGKLLMSRNVSVDEQDEAISIDTQVLNAGLYLVMIKTNQRNVPSRVLVVK